MHRLRTLGSLFFALAAGCGGQAGAELALETRDQPIVRGEETDAFPQAVLLHVRQAATYTRCTGSYIAPRVVLTAAHCIRPGSIPSISYVYFGEGEAPPSADLVEIPPPGEPSDLARV